MKNSSDYSVVAVSREATAPLPLSLFGEAAAPGSARSRPRKPLASTPQDLALHIYWSASLEAHALGSLARQTPHPDEQRALGELQRLQQDVKETAACFLAALSDVRLPPASDPDPLADEDSAAA
jgi:hypothetical protein